MRKGRTLISVIAGMLLGFAMTLPLRPPLVEAHAGNCSVPKTFGALRTARADGWLFFEDSTGVVRAVDTACQVKLTINRE
jgi:hypothetical protein